MNSKITHAAVQTLWRYRMRTGLMMAGVTIGVATFAAVYSIGENTRQETMHRIKNMLGTADTIIVRPGGSTRGMVSLANIQPTLKPADAEAIAAQVPGVVEVGQLLNAFGIEAKYRDRNAVTGVFGVTDNWLRVREEEVERGTFFDQGDEGSHARAAVIGQDVQRNLFAGENPLGKTIRLADVPFEVKGVLAPRGAGPSGTSLDNIVLIPLTTASRRLLNRDYLSMIVVKLKEPEKSALVIENTSALLRSRHQLPAGIPADFNVTDPRAVMDQLLRVGSTLSRVLNAVALAAVLIGGIVITTLMQSSVSERRREIGLRRAVGAGRREIVGQFFAEAVIVSVGGGMAGLALGLGATNAVAAWQHLPGMFSGLVVGEVLALSVVIGLVSGIYPAWKASRVDPVVALRS